MNNYRTIVSFENGALQDARLFGDGYDFQITVGNDYFLSEVKGVRGNTGGIRLTSNEFDKASEFRGKFCLAVVSSLEAVPRINVFFDPLSEFKFSKQAIRSEQVSYSISLPSLVKKVMRCVKLVSKRRSSMISVPP